VKDEVGLYDDPNESSLSETIHELTVSTDDREMSKNVDSLDKRLGTSDVTWSKCNLAG
jgi:hypothetical protein